jgi:hypothetical protein
VVDRAYTDAELDAAIAAVSDPQRLREAQDLVTRSAPALQRVLALALEAGGWFGPAHHQAVQDATSQEDHGERVRAVSTMFAEESRLAMLVGVAVGFELARELAPMPEGPPHQQRRAAPGHEQAEPPANHEQQEE